MITIKEYLDANGKTSVNAVSSMQPLNFEQPVSPAENLIPKRNIPSFRKEPNDVMVAPPEENGYFPYSAGFYQQDTDIPLGENNPYDGFNQEIETGEISQQSPWSSDTASQVDSMLKNHWQVKSSAPKVLSESGVPFHPDPIQAIRYVSYLAENNDMYKSALLLELKKANII